MMPLSEKLISPKLQQTFPSSPFFAAFFKQFETAFISSWHQSPVHHWFLSSCFYTQHSPTVRVVGLLNWQGGESPIWLPCLFECPPQADPTSRKHWRGRLPTAQTRERSTKFFTEQQNHTHPTVFQPAPCLEFILNHLPVSKHPQLTFEFFPSATEPHPKSPPLIKLYQDPQWQQFAEASQPLNHLFRQIARIDQENEIISFQDLIALLHADRNLSQSLKKSLVQCFGQYLSHFSLSHPDATPQSGIEIFWQTFFQLLFQSIPVPASLSEFSPCGSPITLNANGVSKELLCFQSSSQANETVYWYVQYNQSTQIWELLDIQHIVNKHLFPTYLPAFAFLLAFHTLSPERQMMLQPYWRYFLPMQKIQRLQQEVSHGYPS